MVNNRIRNIRGVLTLGVISSLVVLFGLCSTNVAKAIEVDESSVLSTELAGGVTIGDMITGKTMKPIYSEASVGFKITSSGTDGILLSELSYGITESTIIYAPVTLGDEAGTMHEVIVPVEISFGSSPKYTAEQFAELTGDPNYIENTLAQKAADHANNVKQPSLAELREKAEHDTQSENSSIEAANPEVSEETPAPSDEKNDDNNGGLVKADVVSGCKDVDACWWPQRNGDTAWGFKGAASYKGAWPGRRTFDTYHYKAYIQWDPTSTNDLGYASLLPNETAYIDHEVVGTYVSLS